jgi:hypothetical protein
MENFPKSSNTVGNPQQGAPADWKSRQGRILKWTPRRKGKEADLKKLRSVIEIQRQQAQLFIAAVQESRRGSGPKHELVRKLLCVKEWDDDEDASYEYAERLSQLLPLIADEEYLYTTLRFELAGGSHFEKIKLTDVFDRETLVRFQIDARDGGRGSQNPAEPNEIAESLRLLYRARDDQRRHDRLVTKLRRGYLYGMGGLVSALLVALALAVILVDTGGQELWERLLVVGFAGALGSALAATFKLRDVAELDAFRSVAAITFIQPVIGASFGVASLLILTAGAIAIGELDNAAWQTQAIVGFGSGFSEPFFLGIIGRVITTE